MTLEEFRQELNASRRVIDEQAKAIKDSQSALEALSEMYGRFTESDRKLADQVVAEWVASANASVRFEALWLVREFGIEVATPALRQLEVDLLASTAPGAPYELIKVRRILDGFGRKPSV